ETLVVDWGLAKALDRGEHGDGAQTEGGTDPPLHPASGSALDDTLPGKAVGTPEYMSPEQAAGRRDLLGPASDVYSLGATLYCLLTGQAPFDRSECDAGELLRRVQHGEFQGPCSVKPTVPRALEAVCLKAMAVSPENRYHSVQAMTEDLERWMADEPV